MHTHFLKNSGTEEGASHENINVWKLHSLRNPDWSSHSGDITSYQATLQKVLQTRKENGWSNKLSWKEVSTNFLLRFLSQYVIEKFLFSSQSLFFSWNLWNISPCETTRRNWFSPTRTAPSRTYVWTRLPRTTVQTSSPALMFAHFQGLGF